MKQLSIGIVILFILVSCSTNQVSLSHKIYPESQSKFVNTSWKITYTNDRYGKRTFDIVLVSDGKVACFNPFDTTPNNDEWEEKDGCIYIYFNNHEAVYKAILFEDNLLVGNAQSQMGGTWNWVAQKYQ